MIDQMSVKVKSATSLNEADFSSKHHAKLRKNKSWNWKKYGKVPAFYLGEKKHL